MLTGGVDELLHVASTIGPHGSALTPEDRAHIARQSHIIYITIKMAAKQHKSLTMPCKQHLDEMCFAVGSQHLSCRGPQPKRVSNPAERS